VLIIPSSWGSQLVGDLYINTGAITSIVSDVDSLQVKMDNLNDPLVGFCFIRSIDCFFVKCDNLDMDTIFKMKIQLLICSLISDEI
jgi:hypothetical protein